MNDLAQGCSEKTKEEWGLARPFLYDNAKYDEVQLQRGDRPSKCAIAAERMEAVMPLLKRQDDDFEPRGFVNLFLVPEEEKLRYRLITETVTINEHTEVPFKLRPATIDEIRAKSRFQGSHAVMFDMASWFYQFELAEEVQQYAATWFAGAWYTFAYGPMGQKQMCHVAHTALTILAETAKERAGVNVALDLFIDNVRAIGSLSDVNAFGEAFLKVCGEASAVVNEPGVEPTQQGEFCGVKFDLTAGTVANTAKTQKKLQKLQASFEGSGLHAMIVQEFLSAFGLLVFASQVLGVPLHPVYYCVKFLRRVCRKLQDGRITLKDELHVWPSLIPIFKEWCRALYTANDVSLAPSHHHVVLITDATLEAWGYVLFADHHIYHGGHRFTGADKFGSINELELRAVRLALNEAAVANAVRSKLVYVIIDNTSAEACIRKRRSARFFLNREVTMLEERLGQLSAAIGSTHYIRSKENPADAKSRFEPLDFDQTYQLRRAVAEVFSAAKETSANTPLYVSQKLSSERFADVEEWARMRTNTMLHPK